MTQFAVGQSITTTTPTIVVDAGLAIGSHRFQLVVVDSAGLRSAADVQVVAIQRQLVVGPVIGTVVNPVATPVTPVRPAIPRARKPPKASA
jgi:hypothetical protein